MSSNIDFSRINLYIVSEATRFGITTQPVKKFVQQMVQPASHIHSPPRGPGSPEAPLDPPNRTNESMLIKTGLIKHLHQAVFGISGNVSDVDFKRHHSMLQNGRTNVFDAYTAFRQVQSLRYWLTRRTTTPRADAPIHIRNPRCGRPYVSATRVFCWRIFRVFVRPGPNPVLCRSDVHNGFRSL